MRPPEFMAGKGRWPAVMLDRSAVLAGTSGQWPCVGWSSGFGRAARRTVRGRQQPARRHRPRPALQPAHRRPPPLWPWPARTGPVGPATVPAAHCPHDGFHAAAVPERHRRPAPLTTAPEPRLASRPGPRIPRPRCAAPSVSATAPAGHPHPRRPRPPRSTTSARRTRRSRIDANGIVALPPKTGTRMRCTRPAAATAGQLAPASTAAVGRSPCRDRVRPP